MFSKYENIPLSASLQNGILFPGLNILYSDSSISEMFTSRDSSQRWILRARAQKFFSPIQRKNRFRARARQIQRWILRARAQKFFFPIQRRKSFPRPGAVDPKVDSPRPSAENFLPYIEKKIVSAPGRGRSKGGFSAPERRNFSPLYREEHRFRARARQIQRWILRARAQKIFSPIQRRKSFPRPGAVDPKVDSPRPSAEIFLPYIEKKSFPRSGAVDPKVDSPPPSAEIFLSYIEKKIVSAPGRGRSKGRFSAPERRNFSPLYREENRFRARARQIQRWILRARAQKLFSPIQRRKSFPRSDAVDPKVDSPRPSAENFLPYIEKKIVSAPGRAVDPKVERRIFSPLYREKIVSAPGRGRSKCGYSAPERRKSGRGRSKGGFSAPERRNFSFLYREENRFRARARQIQRWILRARAQKLFSPIQRRKSFMRSGAVDPKVDSPRPSTEIFLPYIEKKSFPRPAAVDPNVDSPRPSAENPGAVDPKVDSPRPSAETFLSYIEKKIVSALGRGRFSAPERRNFSPLYREENRFRARARQIQRWILRARAQKIFSPIQRRKSFPRPGAVDPKVDSLRPSAETFLPYIEKKIVSALGRGRSKGGFSAPERRKFSPLYREENRFRARARQIQRWILLARAQKFFSPIQRRKSFPRPGAVDPNVDSPCPSAENPGAVDPKVDSPRPSAENFLPYIEKKIVSAPGRSRSKGGFSAPERRNSTGGSSAEGRGRCSSGSRT